MDPDQTALLREQSDLGPYFLQYWLPKLKQTTINVNGGGSFIEGTLTRMCVSFSQDIVRHASGKPPLSELKIKECISLFNHNT